MISLFRSIGFVACASLVVFTACDPCAGEASCNSGPRLALEGSLVEHLGGGAASGVRVDVIRTGGIGLRDDSSSTLTDGNGHWQIAVPASASGNVTVGINVHSPVFATYRVRGLSFATTNVHGDGHVLQPWVVDPYFPYTAELFYRGVGDVRAAGASITFIPTTDTVGFYVTNAAETVYASGTDAAGRVVLFDIFAHAGTLGTVAGDLIVGLPSPYPPDTIHNLRLTATQLLQTPLQVLRMGIGPSLLYTIQFNERRNNQPQQGAQVTFQRTGGVATQPSSFTATTDAGGHILVPIRPLGNGAVVGDMHVVPSFGTPFTVQNVKLATFHDDAVRFFGVYGVGPALPWVGLLLNGGVGVQGVQADFHRTGGIAVKPSDYTVRSDANGYVLLNPQPQDTGFVEADVTVHSPAPFSTFTTHIRLHTVEDDVSGGVAIQWDLAHPPATSESALPPSESIRTSPRTRR